MRYKPTVDKPTREDPQLVDETTTSTLHTSQRLGVGDPLPDVTMRTLDGKPFPLSALHGTRALIFMWASW